MRVPDAPDNVADLIPKTLQPTQADLLMAAAIMHGQGKFQQEAMDTSGFRRSTNVEDARPEVSGKLRDVPRRIVQKPLADYTRGGEPIDPEELSAIESNVQSRLRAGRKMPEGVVQKGLR